MLRSDTPEPGNDALVTGWPLVLESGRPRRDDNQLAEVLFVLSRLLIRRKNPMRVFWKTISVLSIFGLGYLAGTMQWFAHSSAIAQLDEEGASQEVTKSITAA